MLVRGARGNPGGGQPAHGTQHQAVAASGYTDDDGQDHVARSADGITSLTAQRLSQSGPGSTALRAGPSRCLILVEEVGASPAKISGQQETGDQQEQDPARGKAKRQADQGGQQEEGDGH